MSFQMLIPIKRRMSLCKTYWSIHYAMFLQYSTTICILRRSPGTIAQLSHISCLHLICVPRDEVKTEQYKMQLSSAGCGFTLNSGYYHHYKIRPGRFFSRAAHFIAAHAEEGNKYPISSSFSASLGRRKCIGR